MDTNSDEAGRIGAWAGSPTFAEAFGAWTRIGLLSFGGPTAQIALMHKVIVEERKWLSESQFLNALSFCMLLPGPEAMQLATYAGWRLHGVAGGLAAGLMFVLPGACVVLALSVVYALYGNVPLIEAIFFGIKAAVLVIVVEALLRIARRALKKSEHWLIAALSFLGIFVLAMPFPLIVGLAAAWGFVRAGGHAAEREVAAGRGPEVAGHGVPVGETVKTVATWLAIWWLPVAGLVAIVGPHHVLTELGLFFSKLAVVTFGGAYAVLAYMADTVVTRLGWLEAGQMLDGLGLAETTPGPLILVTEFVGFMAAFRQGGDMALGMGLAGAGVALWVTFAPCFLWIFAGAPYIEWINTQPRLREALAAITAAVVGVIFNLALWFALHVFFARVEQVTVGPFRLWVPEFATLDWRVVLIAVASGVLLLRLHWGIAPVLAVAGGIALVMRFLGL